MKRFPILLLLLLLTGCIELTLELPATPTPTQVIVPGDTAPPTQRWSEASPTPTAILTPTMPASAAAQAPTADLTLVPPPDSVPRSLYFLAQSGLWVLRPNASQAVRLTGQDLVITAFTVWPDGGKIAFATKSGKLYTQNPGKDPLLFLKLDAGENQPYINGLDWSPDGSQLAYSVIYDGGGQPIYADYPSSPSGVWITPLRGGKPTWLISNHYPQSADADASSYRYFSDPQWSPDSKALIIHANSWESSNTHWIYPLRFAEDDRNLHTLVLTDADGATWGHAAWTTDSQGLLFSSEENGTFGGLAYTKRDGTQAEMWQAGELANLYISNAYMVPDDSFLPGESAGIAAGPERMIYIGECPPCLKQPASRIFVMKSKLVDTWMNGSIVGPDALCTRKDANGSSNRPRSVEWNPDFSQGVLFCGSNEIYMIHMHRYSPEETDLLPALPPFSPEEIPTFRWGEIGS